MRVAGQPAPAPAGREPRLALRGRLAHAPCFEGAPDRADVRHPLPAARDLGVASTCPKAAGPLVNPRPAARAVVVCVGICLLATACRAPGEPPTHPDLGVYRDIIRRESDSTHTALATARLLVTTARTQGLPETYARVTLRGAVGDLDHVVTDLHEITPPPAELRPQRRLAAIAVGDAALLARLNTTGTIARFEPASCSRSPDMPTSWTTRSTASSRASSYTRNGPGRPRSSESRSARSFRSPLPACRPGRSRRRTRPRER